MKHTPVFSVQELGIPSALHTLTQLVILAGQEALCLQADVIASGTIPQKESDNPFAAALTDADIAVQTAFALRLKTTFRDVSFFGEEAEHDRVSKYIPDGQPYLVTLDPINGTLYYKNGLPIFETIVTLCEGETRKIVGALIYLPAKNTLYRAINHDGKCQLEEYRLNPQGDILDRVTVEITRKRRSVVYLGQEFADKESLIRQADLQPIFPWRDFRGQPDWTHASSAILSGECIGIINRSTQLIDGGAIAFAAECGGARWLHKPLNQKTMRFEDSIVGVDDAVASLLMSLL